MALLRRMKVWVYCFTLAPVAFFSSIAHAAYFYIEGGGGVYDIKDHTFLDERYYHVTRQRFDFSCGSAALATLLNYSYQRPSDERDIIKSMYARGNKEKISHEGFSLLDMKNYLQSIGFNANGYRAPLGKLETAGIPAIALIKRNGYMHFVVIQGIEKDKILLGDPALGKKVVLRKDFEKMWENHILFIIEDKSPYAHQMFNSRTAWHMKKITDFSMPLPDTDLASTTLMTSYTPNSFRF